MKNTGGTKAVHRTIGIENSKFPSLKVVFYSIGIQIGLVIAIATSGVSYAKSVLLCIALVIQWIPGAIIWAWSNKNRINSVSELVGMGLALGTLLSLFSSQLFRTTSLQRFGWAIPSLIGCLFYLCLKIKSKKIFYVPIIHLRLRQIFTTIVPILSLVILQLSTYSRWNPITWIGWWKFHIDLPYFESYSNSLATLGTTENFINSKFLVKYHWFAYAWVGSLGNSLNLDPLIVLTRILPLVTFCMAATISYAWAKDYSKKFLTPIIAALIVVAGPGLSIGSYVMLRSPSQAIAGCWCLAFSLLFLRIIDGRITGITPYFMLALLAAGVVGGKGSNLAVIGVGVLSILFISLRQIQTSKLRIYISCIVSLVVFVGIYEKLIASSEIRPLNFGVYLGWPSLFLTITPFVIGIYGLLKFRNSSEQSLLTYSLALLFSGSLLSLFTHHPAGNQIYFVLTAALVCVVPSLIGIEKVISNSEKVLWQNIELSRVRHLKVAVSIIILIGGIFSSLIWANSENMTGNLGKIYRAIAPLPIYLSSLFICLLAIIVYKHNQKRFSQRIELFLVSLLVASMIASVSGTIQSIYNGPIYSRSAGVSGSGKSTSVRPGSISFNYVKAGKWVQENIKNGNLFFTNRQCIDAKSSYSDCEGYWYYASAFSKHQFLIEGAAMTNLEDSDMSKMSARQALSYRFSLAPNMEDLKTLWESNVRWGWIDRQVSDISDWKGLAKEIYANSDISIIELIDPTK
jgi:hypothetical protein